MLIQRKIARLNFHPKVNLNLSSTVFVEALAIVVDYAVDVLIVFARKLNLKRRFDRKWK
jgi:hypothetical protein